MSTELDTSPNDGQLSAEDLFGPEPSVTEPVAPEPAPAVEAAVVETPTTPPAEPVVTPPAQSVSGTNTVQPEPTLLAPTDIVPPDISIAPPQQQTAPVQQQQQQPQVAPQLSQEELRKQLNIYEVTEKDYDAIFDTNSKAESIAALNAVLENKLRQTLTMTNVLINKGISDLQNKVQPYMQFADDQKHMMLEQAFFSENPDLANQGPLVGSVVAALNAKGYKFKTQAELFSTIAKETKAYQQRLTGQTQSPTATNAPAKTMASKPRMASLSTGGQGGGGNSTGGSSSNTPASIFG